MKLKPFLNKDLIEAGCDEAGRGCLAGPVVAAAVILPKNIAIEGLDDSKKLTRKTRDKLRPVIEQNALAWAVGIATPAEIDEINILNASYLAMHRAIDLLTPIPEALLIDGNRYKPHNDIPYTCVIGGDGKFLSIAAASVLAKTTRDSMMQELDSDFPQYGWAKNKGYPTAAHREAIATHGPTPHHRKSFTLLPKQLKLEL